MTQPSAPLILDRDGVACTVADGALRITDRGEPVASFPLAPIIDGKRAPLGPWVVEGCLWRAPFADGPGSVVLEARGPWLRYALELSPVNLDRLTFFADSDLFMERWRTFYIADQDCFRDVDEDVAMPVSTCVEPRRDADYHGLQDPGDRPSDWLADTPPRVVAFAQGRRWMTLSVPGPLPIGAAVFRVLRRRFSLAFDTVRLTCRGARSPEVFFAFNAASAEDCLDEHAAINRSLGYFRQRDGAPAWWAQPYFGVLDEMMGHCDPSMVGTPPPEKNPATPDRIRQWVARIEGITGVHEFLVVFDQCYFARYGEYVPLACLGGQAGFRRLIDDLRADGKRVGLYFHTFNADTAIPRIAAHPEWVAARRDRRDHPGAPPTRVGMRLQALDWTRPAVRDYMRDRVRYLLSDDPDCLNADWLCVHNNRTPDPRRHVFHDPDWGIGDQMTFNVWGAVYETAKRVKPECLVRFLTTDSYFQPCVDRVYLNEDWNATCDNWFIYARVATRTYQQTLIDVTPWFLGMTKARQFYMVMPAFGIPGTLALSFFIHPRAHLYPTRPRDHRRLAGSWQVYVNAPMSTDQQRRVDFDGIHLDAWRKYTTGPLAGFYASCLLSPRAYATYSERESRFTATEDRMVNVPLPPGATVAALQAVPHEGGTVAHEYDLLERDGQSFLRTHVTDCGGGICFYRARYRLP